MGWIAAIQQPQRWLVTQAPQPHKGTRNLQVDDVLLKIDGHDLSRLGPLAVVAILDDVPFGHVQVTIERDVQREKLSVFGEGVETDGTVKSKPGYLKDVLQKRGQSAPPFSLKNLENQDVSLSQYRGRWVLLNAWSTWCCMDELPALDYLSSHYHNRVAVIGIAVNDKRDALKQFLAKRRISYPVLLGGTFNDAFVHSYGVHTAPMNILIAPDGTVRFAGVGSESLKSAVEMLTQIERLRASPESCMELSQQFDPRERFEVPERVRVSQRVMRSLMTNQMLPDCPEDAISRGIQGTVVLFLAVDEKGHVSAAKVVLGDSLVAATALTASTRLRFRPYYLNGEAVPIAGPISYELKCFSTGATVSLAPLQ